MRLRHVVGRWDWLRLHWWLRRKSKQPIQISLQDGSVVFVRPSPSLDFMIFYEVFINRAYEPIWPDTSGIRRIVDVGGYVGYSCLFWNQRFPGGSITVYEPLPEHVACIHQHLAVNRLPSIVVRPVAAAAKEGKLYLTSASAASRVETESGAGRVAIDVVDFFKDVGPEPIDLLKLDCEGGESALLNDPRFGQLNVKWLVMECHDQASRASPTVAATLARRLNELHYETKQDDAMVWARR